MLGLPACKGRLAVPACLHAGVRGRARDPPPAGVRACGRLAILGLPPCGGMFGLRAFWAVAVFGPQVPG